MELREAILNRRSIRSFKKEEVDVTTIEELLEIARYAPNHKMTQPWRFVLLDRQDQAPLQHLIKSKKALKKGKPVPEQEPLSDDAPSHMLAVIIDVNEKEKVYRDDYGAVSSLIQNFSLLAWEKGIGVVWKTPGFMQDEEMKQLLEVSEHEELVGLLHIGYPAVVPKMKEREPLQSKLRHGLTRDTQ
ncbi:NAD(P)H nitroreductase [Pontibacillus chungwhensis BH030062]|uniref:Putative NAD(P)H nitroreductase n=1 Tax=Pontibacillus chungwhensis BH030062 TaxID=1385513 RepID=A0A0A2UUB1_9BACI|nr:nitroreductase [Pontibacillus chungwhensis]KGP90323.1 NAD(P)H nitroreductase [Pontibacillus chungwhensis BH030062]